MSLIVRQLKEYHTNRSIAFAGTRCFYLDQIAVNPHKKNFEIASGSDLENYCFYLDSKHLEATDIKRLIKESSIRSFIAQYPERTFRWNEHSNAELDWSNPPQVPRLCILVQIVEGQCDFTSPALFLYVPEAIKKPRRRTRMKPLPKGTGPIEYRL